MTGELLFLYFAWPCFDVRLSADKTLIEYQSYLQECIDTAFSPESCVLEKCFPGPIPEMSKLAEVNKRAKWGLENVWDYWCNHHLRSDWDCQVLQLEIDQMAANGIAVALKGCTGKTFINLYGLSLKEAENVFVHSKCVIIKESDLLKALPI